MLIFRSKKLLLFLSLSIFIALTSGSSHISHTFRATGADVERDVVTPHNSFLILAKERTLRKDPLDDFHKYTGGWDISNRHYWASAGWTAAPFFIIAGLWLVICGLICFCVRCCPREPYGYSKTAYALSFIFLIFFTVAAIVGCIVLYTGQAKFYSSTTKMLEYVKHQANTTVKELRKVTHHLGSAKRIGVDSIFLPADVQKNIFTNLTKFKSAVTDLSNTTKVNLNYIDNGLNSIRVALIVAVVILLCLVFLGFVCSILRLPDLLLALMVLGWITFAITFSFSGVFLVVHNVVADACVSMDEWIQHPTAHTALDDVLPCMDNATAQELSSHTKDVTYKLVSMVDRFINNISNLINPPKIEPIYFNQSGPLLPLLCNPYNSDLTDRKCAPGEVELENARKVWKSYVCRVNPAGICTTPGRLTLFLYYQMKSAVKACEGLYSRGPFLVDLLGCTFVRDTVTSISRNCPRLRKHSSCIYIGFALMSAAVMLSLIFWVMYTRERMHQKGRVLKFPYFGDSRLC